MDDPKPVHEETRYEREDREEKERQANFSAPKDAVFSPHDDEIAERRVAEALAVDDRDIGKYQLEIDTLIGYARQLGAKSLDDILWEVRYLASKLGSPVMGDSKIRHLYRYVFLQDEKQKINSELKRFETVNGNGN